LTAQPARRSGVFPVLDKTIPPTILKGYNMKLMTALVLAAGLTTGAAGVSMAQVSIAPEGPFNFDMSTFSPATTAAVDSATTATVIAVDPLTFDGDEMMAATISELRQAVATNVSLNTELENNAIDVNDIIAVHVNSDGSLQLFVDQDEARPAG